MIEGGWAQPGSMSKNWYVVHTYSGYENKVKANLEKRVESMGMQDKIFRVLVPMEEEIEMKNGKRKVIQRKVFPGYVLVEMIVTDDSWYVVRNTPGVTGFVGAGSKPIPLQNRDQADFKTNGDRRTKTEDRFYSGSKCKSFIRAFENFVGRS